MYVTSANECYALDAGSGRQIWHYQRPRTKGLVGNAAGGVNRGVAVAGDRVFMVTDHAHLIALNRIHRRAAVGNRDGGLAPELQRHRRSAARRQPGRLRHARAATKACADSWPRSIRPRARRCGASGRCRSAGEPGSETWQGKGIDHPGGTTWMTGAYDPQLDTVYWPVGNPGPDLIGDDRHGDNLYTDSSSRSTRRPAR